MEQDDARQRAREDVVLFCRRMQAEGLVVWTAGNLSTRVAGEPNLIAMTPANTPYDTMTPDDVCIVRPDGSIVDGSLDPTSEFPLHTLLYQRRPE
ncbi:MAG: class II aldolase/adducin family protein, partial [Candidatus Limnocylindrales bacterium]